MQVVHNICNVIHKAPKKIPAVFHQCCRYSYYFIIKKLAEEFKGQLDCSEEKTEKIKSDILLKFIKG